MSHASVDYDARLRALKSRASADGKFIPDIQHCLGMYTIPIDVFRDENLTSESHIESFSGVLLNIDSRFFVLTAGHCVKAIRGNRVRLRIARGGGYPYLLPSDINSSFLFVPERGIDWGYLEVAPHERRVIESQDRIFMSDKRITIISCEHFSSSLDMPILCGFPAKRQATTPAGTSYEMLTLFLGSPRPDDRYINEEFVQAAAGVQSICFFGSPAASDGTGGPSFDIPSLAGASGCGVWNGAFHVDPEQWSTDKLSLIAIHSGGRPTDSAGQPMRFSVEVLVGHHLRLIADNEPGLKQYIYRRWPMLSDQRWSV